MMDERARRSIAALRMQVAAMDERLERISILVVDLLKSDK